MSAELQLSAAEFDDVFPFHVGFREDGELTHVGRSWRRLAPQVRPGALLGDVLRPHRPDEPLTFERIAACAGQLCILREPVSGALLRGQMQKIGGRMFFLGSPWLDSTTALGALGLTSNDYAVHDPTLDLLHLLQLRKIASDDLERLAARLAAQTEQLRAKESETRKLAWVAARTDNAVVITNPAGEIEWVNEGFTRITGYMLGECVGRKPGSFLQGPATDPRTVAYMSAQIRRGEAFKTEIINYDKQGRPYWLAIEAQPIHDAIGRLINFMAIESDITDRRQADDNMRTQFGVAQALATARSIGEAAAATLGTVGAEMRWAMGLLWLVDPAETTLACAERWCDGRPETSAFMDVVGVRRFRRGEGVPGSAWGSGKSQWLSDATQFPGFQPEGAGQEAGGLRCGVAVPVMRGDRFLGVVEFFSRRSEPADDARMRTLTAVCSQLAQFIERMRAEEALRKHTTDLARANVELAQAARTKSVFLASMSHELRTPLTGILGMSETLLEQVYGPLNEQQIRYLKIVEKSGRHLLTLINDLLDVAKIEAGQFELNRQTCSLEEVCDVAIRFARNLAAGRAQRVSYVNGAPRVQLRIDARRIGQVLESLLGNAVKFSPPGGEFGLETRATETEVVLIVWDRGIGISADDLPRLFRSFVQLDERLARKYAGTGLGLALVKQLVEMHGGRITVVSQLGSGSMFTITLPREEAGANGA